MRCAVLVVKAPGVDVPQQLDVVREDRRVLPDQQRHRQQQRVQVVPEHPVGFEHRPVLLQHGGHHPSLGELEDQEPESLQAAYQEAPVTKSPERIACCFLSW